MLYHPRIVFEFFESWQICQIDAKCTVFTKCLCLPTEKKLVCTKILPSTKSLPVAESWPITVCLAFIKSLVINKHLIDENL